MPTPDAELISSLPAATSLQTGDMVPVLRLSAPLPKDQNILVPAAAFVSPGAQAPAGQLTANQLKAAQSAAQPSDGNPFATLQDVAHVAVTEGTARFYTPVSAAAVARYGAGGLSLHDVLETLANAQGVTRPDAPTNPQVDDTGDTFSAVPNALFPALGDNEAFYPGSAGTVALTSTNSYLTGGRIYLRVTTNAAPGTVGIRVAASGNRPASAFVTNATAFTGTAATPPPMADTTPPAVAFTFPASGATLTAGTQVTLAVTATDNVAVQGVAFSNGSTGAALGAGAKNGTSYTLAFTVPSTAGALSLTATATDTSGNTATATVNVTVQAAAPANSLAANSSTPS